MRGIRRKLGVLAVTGALVFVVAAPASAATSGWFYSDHSNVHVGLCWLTETIANNNVTVKEDGYNGCPGSVGAQGKWTNGQSTYNSVWVYSSEVAVASQFLSVAVNGYHS